MPLRSRITKTSEPLKKYPDDQNNKTPLHVDPIPYDIRKQQNPTVGQNIEHTNIVTVPQNSPFIIAPQGVLPLHGSSSNMGLHQQREHTKQYLSTKKRSESMVE